jgi:hypothetical protein
LCLAGDCSRSPYLEKDRTLWWGIAAGLLFTAEFILVYWGLEFTNASRAIIFLNISPFVVALGAQLFIPGEQLRKIQVVGLCCAFAGIVVAFSESASYTSYRMTSADLRLTNCGCRSPRRRRYNPYEPEASLCSIIFYLWMVFSFARLNP